MNDMRTFRLDQPQWDALAGWAAGQGMTRSDAVRIAIAALLQAEGVPVGPPAPYDHGRAPRCATLRCPHSRQPPSAHCDAHRCRAMTHRGRCRNRRSDDPQRRCVYHVSVAAT